MFIENEIYSQIKKTLIKSVKDRLQSERPLGALLSGGLDSSLVCGIASKILREEKNEKLHTFSIGMTKDSPDLIYARKVAEYIDSNHNEIVIPVETWLETLDDVINQIETYDITTIRASTAQYLLAKWIKENTDIKVLLNGDGSDEITSGYLYFYNAPNSLTSHSENIDLLTNIHKYDVLRVDRTISAFGLEARVPFLQHHFVDLYLSIDKELRYPIKFKRPEKYLLRKAFENDKIIPEEVLYRTKEAFSDGCSNLSKSWYEYITEYIETKITDEEFEDNKENFPSKESLYYYKKFIETHPNSNLEVKYWLPSWSTEHKGNPSARVLNIYNEN
jgi:asparagine synthase (glutamine-hydrolysing)